MEKGEVKRREEGEGERKGFPVERNLIIARVIPTNFASFRE